MLDQAFSALIILAFYAFAIWTAWPPNDLLLSRFRGQSRPFLPFAIGSLLLGTCQPWVLPILFWIEPHVRNDAQPGWVRMGTAFDAVGILPYFDHNIFANWERPFWWWSEKNPSERTFDSRLASRPDILLIEYRFPQGEPIQFNDPGFHRFTDAGYRMTHSFCGTMPVRLEAGYTSCHIIFQREIQPAVAR